MYEINYQGQKNNRKSAIFCIAFGVLVAAAIAFAIYNMDTLRKSLDSEITPTDVYFTEDENSDGDTVYSPVYKYTVDGRDYECTSTMSASHKPTIKDGKVYYDSKNPEKCMTDYSESSTTFLYIMLIFPALLIIGGAILLKKALKTLSNIKRLSERGHLVKDLPFYMEHRGVRLDDASQEYNSEYVYVDYNGQKLRTAETIKVSRIHKYDKIDLLIDDSDPSVYYLEFNIHPKGKSQE